MVKLLELLSKVISLLVRLFKGGQDKKVVIGKEVKRNTSEPKDRENTVVKVVRSKKLK